MVRVFQLMVALLCVCLGLAFHVKNSQPVLLDLYIRQFQLPLSWLMVAALVLGAGLGILAMLNTVLRLKRALRRLRKQHESAFKTMTKTDVTQVADGP